ncbi:MAG: zf-HC2 domain-containing protein [Coleofasciculaceae cyanobacterium SM2_1_6]|nr:zf-HC2 domain-containing protein [Coleofasciculaceae cyanobacterium SM2_1_6]
MNGLEKDDFELLSAFLDGEVTAIERQRVQQLLSTDEEIQRLYRRLLRLRQNFDSLPVPVPTQSSGELCQRVFAKVDRRRQQRFILGFGGAIAALAVGAFSLMRPSTQSLPLQIVQEPSPSNRPELLMIAVNRPVIEIPASMTEEISPSPLQTN